MLRRSGSLDYMIQLKNRKRYSGNLVSATFANCGVLRKSYRLWYLRFAKTRQRIDYLDGRRKEVQQFPPLPCNHNLDRYHLPIFTKRPQPPPQPSEESTNKTT